MNLFYFLPKKFIHAYDKAFNLVGFLSHYNKLTICSVEELSSFQSEIHPPTQVPHHVHIPIRGHPLHIEAVSGDWVKVTPSQ